MCGVGDGSLLTHYSPHQTIRNYSWLLTSDTHPSVQILHHVACPVIYFPWWISTITAHFCLDIAVSQNCFSDWIFKQAICQSAPLNLTYWHQHRQSWSNDSKGERAGGISPQWKLLCEVVMAARRWYDRIQSQMSILIFIKHTQNEYSTVTTFLPQ